MTVSVEHFAANFHSNFIADQVRPGLVLGYAVFLGQRKRCNLMMAAQLAAALQDAYADQDMTVLTADKGDGQQLVRSILEEEPVQ